MKNQITFQDVSYSVVRSALKVRLFLLLFLSMLSLRVTPSHAQSFTWASKTTNTFQKTAVTADKNGVSYVLASFSGSVTVGKRTFTSLGGTDLLLICYNKTGSVVWARQIGSTGNDLMGDVTLTLTDWELYITGSFHATVKFETGNQTLGSPLTSTGKSDIFIAKYSTQSGWLTWAKRAGGTGDDYTYGIAVDKSDNVYMTGSFTGKLVLISGFMYEQALISKGNSDIFVFKFNTEGKYQFASRLGGSGYDMGMAISLDHTSGDIYLTGGYSPETHLYNTNVFVAKLNASGNILWNKVSGTGSTVDTGNDILVINSNAYVTGYFGSSIVFGDKTLTSSGPTDAFMVSYDKNGVLKSATRYGGTGWDEGQSLGAYTSTNIADWELYMGGTFSGEATFGKNSLTALGGAADRDMFLARIYWDGAIGWVQRIGSTSTDYGRGGLSVPTNNFIFYTGSHSSSITLGASTLGGSGSLITRITLPTITSFKLMAAATDTEIKTLSSLTGNEINYLLIGTNQINIQVLALDGSIGSLKLNLDGVEKIDNTEPFTWAGDAPKAGGGTDYFPFTPSDGNHYLVVTPYSGPNCTGVQGRHIGINFKICSQPILTNITLINAFTDGDITNLQDKQTINYSQISTNQINIRANTNPGTVGSVKFELDGEIRTDNGAPYTWAGDTPKVGGGTNYLPVTLYIGSHRLVVKAYTGANATGVESNIIDITFSVETGNNYRLAAGSEQMAHPVSFTVAPNPFNERTHLTFIPSQDATARVEVYNLQGMLIQSLYEGPVQLGNTYNWEFYGHSLPAGLYIARISVGGHVFQQKMILNR